MSIGQEIKVPDIGGAAGVDVIEILVKVGDEISIDTPLVTLESDKASMEIPSPSAGTVLALEVKIGDKVSEGDVILKLSPSQVTTTEMTKPVEKPTPVIDEVEEVIKPQQVSSEISEPVILAPTTYDDKDVRGTGIELFAGPGVRRLARTLGVNLADIQGSGRKSRISKEDVEQFVKNKLSEKSTLSGLSLPAAPVIDFSKFGKIEVKPMSKIKRITGVNVHRAWATIPHVTHFDLADITELEAFRKAETHNTQDNGYKLTILAFVCKVISKALEVFPQFNASLDEKAENLIYKHYCNVGIAVETPNGLVVPVIKDVNQLSVSDIAKEMTRLSKKARDKGLMPTDMNGGCFTISSLGGIGGCAFTPIVNSPEVAILGLSRSTIQPVYIDGEFVPRLMLPLSLSYDHRVIDGAEAARFTRFVSEALSDIRRILL